MASGIDAMMLRSEAAEAMTFDDVMILTHACSINGEAEHYADSDVITLLKKNPLPEIGDDNFETARLKLLEEYRQLILQPSTHADMYSIASIANHLHLVSIINFKYTTKLSFLTLKIFIYTQTILFVQWGICMESLPKSSTSRISTRRNPAVKPYQYVDMSKLFWKLVGNRPNNTKEKFVILFASGTGQCSHFDIVRASHGKNQIIFAAAELPRIVRKYWKIPKPPEDNINALLSQFIETDFIEEERPSSPPDSPCWQSQEAEIETQQEPVMKAMSVNFSEKLTLPAIKHDRSLMVWKIEFCELFKNSNRTSFVKHIPPSMITSASFIIDNQYEADQAPTRSTVDHMHNIFRSIMNGIWICFEDLTTNHLRQQRGSSGFKVYQTDTENYFVSQAVSSIFEIRDSMMFIIRMIAHNISVRKNGQHVPIAQVLRYLGFHDEFLKSTNQIFIYRWIYGNAGNPENKLVSMTDETATHVYKQAFTMMIERLKYNRNSINHPGKHMLTFNAAELITALAVLSGVSNNNTQQIYDIQQYTTQWYQ